MLNPTKIFFNILNNNRSLSKNYISSGWTGILAPKTHVTTVHKQVTHLISKRVNGVFIITNLLF